MELSKKYHNQLKGISKTSKGILKLLKEHYTENKLKEFKNQEEFLDDINYVCENGGTGKLIFIKEVESKNIW